MTVHGTPAHPARGEPRGAAPVKPVESPASVYAYPEALERVWVAMAHAKAPRSSEGEAIDRVAPAATRLSELFTTARPVAFPDYGGDTESRVAYGLFFVPQTWVRTRLALAEVVEARGRALGRDGVVSVLDLGAGLGAAGWGAAHWLVARDPTLRARLVAVDRSAESLRDFVAAVEAVPSSDRRLDVETVVADLAAGPAPAVLARAPFHLVVVSFALNEAFPPPADDAARAWLASLSGLLADDGVLLVVEPALRETASRLRDLARPLVASGALHALAPDLDGRVALPHDDLRFVDHEVRRWRKPRSLVRLNRTLRRSLDELTFSFVALSRTPAPGFPAAPRRVRLTSPFARLKGRRAFTALGADGTRATFDLLERTLADEATRARVLSIERGDHVEVLDATPLRERGWWRLAGPDALRVAWTPR